MINDSDRFKLIGKFAGQIAHEFNNFLTPLIAYPQIIREGLPTGTQYGELLDAIERTAKDMTVIMRQLMSLSSKGTQTRQILDVNEIVESVASLLRMCPETKGIEIELQSAPGLAQIKGSAEGIRETVESLCWNGIEAMPEGGRLVVKTENVHVEQGCSSVSGLEIEVGRHVRISVSDNGSGIPDHVKDKIFEPFVTTKKGMNRRRAGLGLTVAYRVMRDHHGAIEHGRAATGNGTTFMLYFPVERSFAGEGGNGIAVETTAKSPGTMVPRNKSRILIADDEKTIQRLFSMILSSALPGVGIDLVSNGMEALEAFGSGHHGALVMDLHMPVMDGYAAFNRIERLCKDRNWEMPPTVFCTGFAPPDVVANLVAGSPMHHLLSKPVGAKVLIEAVKSKLA